MKSVTKKHTLSIKKVVQGYLFSIASRHLSQNTIADYQNTIKKFMTYLNNDEKPFDSITRQHIEGFLASVPNVTNKTLLNYHTGLSALWTWAIREKLTDDHIVHQITPPKPEKREILPYTEEDVRALLNAVARSKTYERVGKRKSDHGLPGAYRMRAIILMLLDTGLRASEITSMRLLQIDKHNSRVQVLGKGALERSIPLSPRTSQAIWRYLATRDDPKPDAFLFVTSMERSIDRTSLGKMLNILGNRAGIINVHPHRFRHTFAIQYLRNGGDPYTLQRLLGHSTLDMVKVYLKLAQVDVDKAHRRASPVDNWAL